MNITFFCPDCDELIRDDLTQTDSGLACSKCDWRGEPLPGSVDEEGVHHCAVCPSEELYLRKDFSQTLGLAIICIGFAVSCVPWYYRQPVVAFAILFATAAFDGVLWYLTGNVLECYRCRAQYRNVPGLDSHAPFDLEVYEKYRQQAARLAQEERQAQIEAWQEQTSSKGERT